MLSSKKFRKRYSLSYSKYNQMIEYLSGVYKCPCCNGYLIPDSTKPIFIPDKRKYKNEPKKYYYYVLEAIHLQYELVPSLSLITDEQIKTCISELKRLGWIVLKNGSNSNSLDYHNYIISINCPDWNKKKEFFKELTEMLTRNISEGVSAAIIKNSTKQV